MYTILSLTSYTPQALDFMASKNSARLILKLLIILGTFIPWSSSSAAANEKLEKLYVELKQSKTESAARAIENRIWQNWILGPNKEATNLLAKAMERRRAYDFSGSLKILNKLVEITPNWAEGWNQRAFVHFLREEFDKSLEDADRAIKLEPNHFGALAGKAQILMSQGRTKLGQKALRKAIKLHPFLRERALLIEMPGQPL